MEGLRGARERESSREGREASKPARYGLDMSGAEEDEVDEGEVEGEEKKRTFAEQMDLWSQSREWRDQVATARRRARRTRSSRSGVDRSGEAMAS